MKNKVLSCEERLRNMMVIDKKENPQRIEKLLKSEVVYVLKNYFDITSENIDLKLIVEQDGKYHLTIDMLSNNIKIARCF
ncbi:MAG: hypothetical protein E7354_00575 [Clostridiales bacterium]|nr:hypothetical protein [Clostridiales bacterium]